MMYATDFGLEYNMIITAVGIGVFALALAAYFFWK